MGRKCRSGSSLAHSTRAPWPLRVSKVGPGDAGRKPRGGSAGRSRCSLRSTCRMATRKYGTCCRRRFGVARAQADWLSDPGMGRGSTNLARSSGSSRGVRRGAAG